MIKSIFKRVVILLLVLPLILLILELGIRITAPQPLDEITFDDIYTTRFSPALNTEVKSLVPGIIRIKHNAEVHINNDGNRDYEYSRDKNEGIKRIAIVGSSVAFGFNLKLDDTFGKKLEKKLNEKYAESNYEVLLFGRPGFSAKETYACVKDEIFDYNPDLIVYSFVQNNYENSSFEEFFANQTKTKIANNKTSIEKSESFLKKIREKWWKVKQNDTLKYFRSHFHFYLFTANSIASILRELSPVEKEKAQSIASLFPDDPEFKKKIRNTETWITSINMECKIMNVPFCLLMHPYEMQVNEEGVEKWKSKGINIPDDVLMGKSIAIMKQYSENEGFLFIDVTPALRANNNNEDELFLSGDYGHYSEFGHEIIAAKLADELLNKPAILPIDK